MTPVYVAAGSNVEPEKNLARACEEIRHTWPDAVFSRAYRNKAVGFDGPDFINLVLGFHTAHPIDYVIGRLRSIETHCGRPRYAPKWASRTMDLDVLLFGARIEKTSEWTLPRPDLLKRPYMLGPMAEIAPAVQHPVEHRTIAELWSAFDLDGHEMVVVSVPGIEPRVGPAA
ncbi:MAG TPA: 2-amino-4-hydroxy-6-hydroxymethyldihydropteridine diphosphokinase [Steroidobacteraceae bacterium]|nr:2-amino-4-hydroxy-6-hydroxymethyldihydropteridine diphosphokinase [Steroidobacteraceae bacterium]